MGIRMSGLVSGLDTESIIKELMNAQSLKKTKIDNKMTKHEWKQEKWKDINTKIYSFYTGALSKLKTQGNYMQKAAASSNESKVSATAGTDAIEGSHTLKVNQLASSQYVTGAKIDSYTNSNGNEAKVTVATKLSDLGISEGTIKIQTENNKSFNFDVNNDSTLNDFINACKTVGLSASYDTNQGRLFISSATSGTSNAFQITATGVTAAFDAKNDIRDSVGYSNMATAQRLEVDKAIENYVNSNSDSVRDAAYDTLLKKWNAVNGGEEGSGDASDLDSLLRRYESASRENETTEKIDLSKIGLSEITYTKDNNGNLAYGETASGVSLVGASNSKVVYNGAELENSTNTITANGLTVTLHDITADNETITLTVSKDTDSVYDMVKSILKEYNDLLGGLTDSYDAKSARGYEPLTDDEREAMTEEQIEKWEDKIKDSLLRRDDTLNGIINTMKSSLAGTVQYNGKSYSLSSFGISTKYYTEKGKLHIAGDTDDTLTADDKDKLKAALAEDPNAVKNVLSGLAQNLYDNVNEKMKSTKLSSALTIYNDKQMKTELEKYNEELKKMETKLQDIEDRYYKQFSAMEKAMSSLNSQSNSLASMLGTGTQSS